MKLVDDFEAAVRLHEMKGANRPEDHEYIELLFETTKQKLIEALRRREPEAEQMR